MTFSKLENFRNLKIINNLSANATKVLFLIIQTISQDNLIEIRILTFASILNMSKPTLIKSLNELVDCGIISKMQSRTKTSGTIYMLNPVIASAGKHTHKTIYKKITQKAFLSKFEELNKNDYCVISSKGFISINENENQYLCFNSLSNTLVNNSNESDDDLFI
jgi:predicted transcriptional regulator